MKKILVLSALTVGFSLSVAAQKVHSKSATTHKHKTHVYKQGVKTQHSSKMDNAKTTEIHAVNDRHKAAIAAIKANTTLTPTQQEEQIKAANMQHKSAMQARKKH